MEFSNNLPKREDINNIVFKTCSNRMTIQLIRYKNEDWWCIKCDDLPDRFIKKLSSETIFSIIKFFGFLDNDSCMNYSKGLYFTGNPLHIENNETLDYLSKEQRNVIGVPQLNENSGNCWFCALLFIMFFNATLKEFLFRYFPKDLQNISNNILNDPKTASNFKRILYYYYAFGDDPQQDPAFDGQNGFAQFCILCSKFDIPIVCLMPKTLYDDADDMLEFELDIFDQKDRKCRIRRNAKNGEKSLLVVKIHHTKWLIRRRIIFEKRRYKLAGMLIASEACGHQVGCSTLNMNITRFALSDADAISHKVPTLFWHIAIHTGESKKEYKKRWLEQWEKMIPINMFSEACDLNPANSRNSRMIHEHKKAINNDEIGVVNSEIFYLSE